LLWAVHTLAAAFLRRSSITGFPRNFKPLTHCAYFQHKPDLWRQIFGTKPFWTVRLDKNSATIETGTAFAPQNNDLERVDFTMDETDFFALFFPCFFCVMFSSDGKSLAAT
jgi:hypothetical protein